MTGVTLRDMRLKKEGRQRAVGHLPSELTQDSGETDPWRLLAGGSVRGFSGILVLNLGASDQGVFRR